MKMMMKMMMKAEGCSIRALCEAARPTGRGAGDGLGLSSRMSSPAAHRGSGAVVP
jgi:hypothetical protein